MAVARANPFSAPVLGSRTSPYLQARLVRLAAELPYAHVPPLVRELLGIDVSATQVYRRTQAAAAALPAAALDAPCPEAAPAPGQPVYAMVDGSMLFTDTGWQEVKVGRVFQAAAPGQAPPPSQYVAQRGPCAAFTQRLAQVLPATGGAEQVFVTDGAVWIHHWLQAAYPRATHILDFYHVAERLGQAAQAARQVPAGWLDTQLARLWDGQSPQVEDALAELGGLPTDQLAPLQAYLRTNRARLRYDLFRQRGLLVGSGPVEAAHRSLLQCRLKRSGQRWSNGGLDRLVRLRCALKSPQQHLVTNLFKSNTE